MQTVKINTSQNITIDYQLASLGDRFSSYLIDNLIIGGIVAILMILYFGIINTLVSDNVGGIVLVLTILVLIVFYNVFCEIVFNGQSLGKRFMKIKVISLNGGRATIGQYLLRWVFCLVDFIITSNGCAVLCVVLSENNQRLGDIVAGTAVVRLQPKVALGHLAYSPIADDYQPKFTSVTQLTDQDISLLNDVVMAYYKTSNTLLVMQATQRITALLGITKPVEMNDLAFIQTIIADYGFLTSREA